MAHYRPSCLEDINRLAPDVRQADRDEVMASHGLEPLPAITGTLLSAILIVSSIIVLCSS